MADTKITDLGVITSTETDDLVEVVDVSDTSMSAEGTNKKVARSNLIPAATDAATGVVELATNAETLTGTDTERAVTPDGLQDKISFANINAPEGFLVNGKISVTDASGITVAIKGMDGNDPSATNPVYCRINGTIRSITSALSVSKADGTNWFNAGSSELATKEIDYFVYLGYNATDGVVIGFSRYPGASSYDDFSATTTNEKYCAISTITTAAATDYYNVIGRFAATLSAGAGYTWSVPTYTAKNLIQRPIYETRWLTWTPTWTGSGSLTYGTITYYIQRYKLNIETLWWELDVTGTTGGTASTQIFATSPFSRADSGAYAQSGFGRAYDAGLVLPAIAWNSTSQTQLMIEKSSNWGLGAGREIRVKGFFVI